MYHVLPITFVHSSEYGQGSGCIVGIPRSRPMLLTCNHVIPSKDVATKSTIYFDREDSSLPGFSVSGAELFDLDSEDSFVTNAVSLNLHVSLHTCHLLVCAYTYVRTVCVSLFICMSLCLSSPCLFDHSCMHAFNCVYFMHTVVLLSVCIMSVCIMSVCTYVCLGLYHGSLPFCCLCVCV